MLQLLADPRSAPTEEAATNAGDTPPDEATSDLGALFDLIAHGTPAGRQSALDELGRRAEASADPRVWEVYAAALREAGQHADAVAIYEWLAEQLPDEPRIRVDLAIAHVSLGNATLAETMLREVLEEELPDSARKLAEEQLRLLAEWRERLEGESRLRELQSAALRGRRARGEATPEDAVALARLLFDKSVADASGSALDEAVEVLEEAHAQSPDNVSILEHLAFAHARRGGSRFDEILREIERVAPDSPVLSTIRASAEAGDDNYQENVNARLNRSIQATQSDDPATREAGVADLASLVAWFPDNPHYRTSYALALALVGRADEAREQATAAAPLAGDSHAIHFNLGQVFWNTGDPERGRHHLELARAYAADDEERGDVDNMLSYLAGQS